MTLPERLLRQKRWGLLIPVVCLVVADGFLVAVSNLRLYSPNLEREGHIDPDLGTVIWLSKLTAEREKNKLTTIVAAVIARFLVRLAIAAAPTQTIRRCLVTFFFFLFNCRFALPLRQE